MESLDAIDISSGMLQIAQRKASSMRLPIRDRTRFAKGDVSYLPYEDDSFDTVVSTFSLCVFEDPRAVLSEASRVLKPGGTLLLLEHDDGPVGRAMSSTRGASAVASSCDYSQDVQKLVGSTAGLAIASSRPRAGGFFREVVATCTAPAGPAGEGVKSGGGPRTSVALYR